MSKKIQPVADATLEPAEESPVPASATSHLENVRMESIAEDSIQSEALPDVNAPTTLKAAHAALAEAQKEADPRIRKHKVVLLTRHLHDLSQVHAPNVNSLSLAAAQSAAAERIQIEMLGREYPLVKKLADKLAAVEKQLTDLTQPK